MKNQIKPVLILSLVILLSSCGKDEPIPDKSIGEWQVYSITDVSGKTTIWEELKASLIDLIPGYSCMEFTTTITAQIVSTKTVLPDVNSRVCLSPTISVYTWEKDSETGIYRYIQGNEVINYLITFSNGDNRMTWKDQTDGSTTIWDRVIDATLVSSE